MQVRAIVFDLEGTLFSSEELGKVHQSEVLDLLSKKMGVDREEASDLLVCKRKELSAKLGYVPPLTTLVETFGISRLEFYDTISKVDPSPYVHPDAKLTKMLETLRKKGIKLSILTNVSYDYAVRILQALGINKSCFDCLVTGSHLKHLKPNIESFLMITKSLNLSFNQMLMVGDRADIDLAPAKELGMKTALVSRKDSPSLAEVELSDLVLHEVHDLTCKLNHECLRSS